MANKKIIGTLRRLTRAAQKKREKEERARKFLAEALKRERLRKEKIWESKDPEAISTLIAEEVLLQAQRTAEKGCYTDSYDLRSVWYKKKIKKLIAQKLRAMGFAAEIICGRGHPWSCDGASSACWPELHISWGKDSKRWRGKRTRPD